MTHHSLHGWIICRLNHFYSSLGLFKLDSLQSGADHDYGCQARGQAETGTNHPHRAFAHGLSQLLLPSVGEMGSCGKSRIWHILEGFNGRRKPGTHADLWIYYPHTQIHHTKLHRTYPYTHSHEASLSLSHAHTLLHTHTQWYLSKKINHNVYPPTLNCQPVTMTTPAVSTTSPDWNLQSLGVPSKRTNNDTLVFQSPHTTALLNRQPPTFKYEVAECWRCVRAGHHQWATSACSHREH